MQLIVVKICSVEIFVAGIIVMEVMVVDILEICVVGSWT